MPKSRVALSMKISRMALWKIEQKYKKWGKEGLKNHKSGRLFEPLSNKFYEQVISEWKRYKCGARKLHIIFKKRGFKVSRRKIEQVLVQEGLQKPFPKRKKPRKYKRYEWPIPNYMWHTDWHVIKAKKMKGENIIAYLDDCSRKVMGYSTGTENTKNSLFALYKSIADNLVMPFILNSDKGAEFFPNKRDKQGRAFHKFQEALADLGIIFVPSGTRHPQTNGKLERFFGILDSEFDERFKDLDQFIEWYNNERNSEAVDYMTPNEAYQKRL
jgi:putative transposase